MSWRKVDVAPKGQSVLAICSRERADRKVVSYFAVVHFDTDYGLWRDEYHQIHWPTCWMPLPDGPFDEEAERNELFKRRNDVAPGTVDRKAADEELGDTGVGVGNSDDREFVRKRSPDNDD